jgi:outer membrane protein assembly factor BamB
MLFRRLALACLLGTYWVPIFAKETSVAPAEQQASFRAGGDHAGVYSSSPIRRIAGARWRFQTRGPVRSSPAVAGGVVFVGSGDHHLYALEEGTGKEIWRFETGGPVDSSPAVSGDTVYFEGGDAQVYAVNRRDGRERWRFSLGKDLPFTWGYDYHHSSPVVEGERLFIGGGDGYLYALSTSTGKLRWRFSAGGRIRSSPAAAGGVVYCASMEGVFYALDADSGKLRWKYETEGATIDLSKWGFDRRSIYSSPSIARGIVTFGSRDAHQYALDARTGRLLWRFGHPVAFTPDHAELAWVEGSPAIADGISYVGSSDGHFVNAIDLKSGREIWRHATPGRVLSSPAVAGEFVYVGGENGEFFALDRKDGHLAWSYPTPEMVYSSPSLADEFVFFGCDDGAVYALSDRQEGSRFLPWRTVYWDEKLSGWFKGGAVLNGYLKSEGYASLDAAALPQFLRDRIEDGVASVVVFASDQPPSALTEAAAGETPLIRRYLEAGGRVVWAGVAPFSLKFDESTGKKTGIDPALTRKVLGVGRESMTPADVDEVGALATAKGQEWGLPPAGIASMPVDPKDVTTVLASDDNGQANAWIKEFGGGRFIRIWGRQRPLANLESVRKIAEHELTQ